ncbi:MAG: response regulator [Gemmatimonadales bacterium]|nr:response regulator [Gemmatimonadales bacterium]
MTVAPSIDHAITIRSHHAAKMTALTRIAGGITRDIGDVVETAGSTVVELLAELPTSHPVYDRLDDLRESMQRVAAVTRQLRAFSGTPARTTSIDLDAVVERTRPLLERLAGPGVAVGWRPGAEGIRTVAARGIVEQVLLTLVVNARDAMLDGGFIHLSTSCEVLTDELVHGHGVVPPGRWAMLDVRDSGVGMSAETVASLFEPFFTTKPNGMGTGLGLSAIYGMVRQASGHVIVTSKPDEGTAVRVALPASPGIDPCEQSALADGDMAILVVDDDEWLRTVTARMLRRAGYGVLEADGGETALELLRGVAGRCVRLVLTDMMMPGMNGATLASLVEREHPAARVLLMTGYGGGMVPDERFGSASGAVLAKPFTADELLQAVRTRLA